MAMSAFWISCCGRLPSAGAYAIPMLAPMVNSSSPNRNGRDSACRMASARRGAWPGSAPSHSTRNSSPPKRASRPSVPIAWAMRWPVRTSRSSPAPWPSTSLTVLNRSRSMYRTATSAWAGSRRRASSSPRIASRLRMPVSGSVRAWIRSVSSACLRSVMSCRVPATRGETWLPGSTSPIMRTQNEWPSPRWPCSSRSKPSRRPKARSSAPSSRIRSPVRRRASRSSMPWWNGSSPTMRSASPVRYRRWRPRSHSQPPMCASDWARSNRVLSRLSSVMSLNSTNTWSASSRPEENTGTVVAEIQTMRSLARWCRPMVVLGMIWPVRSERCAGHWSSGSTRPCSSRMVHSRVCERMSASRPAPRMRCAAGLADSRLNCRSSSSTPLSIDSISRR